MNSGTIDQSDNSEDDDDLYDMFCMGDECLMFRKMIDG